MQLFFHYQKSPGPIRVYVGFATARLMLSLAGFVYLVMANKVPTQSIITHSIDLGKYKYFFPLWRLELQFKGRFTL